MTNTDKRPGTPESEANGTDITQTDAHRRDSVAAAQEIRRLAEQLFRQKMAIEPKDMKPLSAKEIEGVLHELRVHQIELEMQNDELRRSQAELDATRARYFSLYDLAPIGYCTISEQGLLLEINLTAANLLGVTRSKNAVQPIFVQFIHKEDQDIYYLHRKQLFGTNNPQSCELRMVKKDGTSFWAYLSATLSQDENGSPVCRVVISDITERKLLETYKEMGQEILQIVNEPGETHEALQRVLVSLKTRTRFEAVGIRMIDGDDYPYFVQDGFSRDFLLTENSLIERGADGGVCRDKAGNVRLECTCGLVVSGRAEPSNPFFTLGGSFWTNDSVPLLDIPPDDDPRLHPRNVCIHQNYASVALVPIRNKDGIVGLIQLNDRRKGCFTLNMVEVLEGIASQIGTALMRKQAENEKIKLEAQLQQARKMETIGQLAGGVAHDFNNMLGVILGHAEMAMERMDPTLPLFDDLEEIRNAAQRSADITHQLLAFARKQVIAPQVLDLNVVIAKIVTMLQRLIGENIILIWQPGEDLWPVKMDPTQIDQILTNLCTNARDSIGGMGKIAVETSQNTFNEDDCANHPGLVIGEYVLITISDNGKGMDKETLSHIFEPFFTTKGVGKGTGLGLATVFGAVKQNNGFITAYSEPGTGTTFRIYLPRHVAITAQEQPQAGFSDKPAARGHETILLVEDEPSILKLATKMLERLGYTVLAANTPGEATHLAKENAGEIHLLLTDVIMPEVSGKDLARNIQALYPEIRHLFMSGYTAEIIAQQGILDEDVHFIQKPFSKKDIAAKIREAIDSK